MTKDGWSIAKMSIAKDQEIKRIAKEQKEQEQEEREDR